MCGRMVLTRSAREIADAFALESVMELRPRYNVAPGQPIAAIRERTQAEARGAGESGEESGEGSSRHLSLLSWGLVPGWAKDRSIGRRLINARSETAAEKPSFRTALRRRRCIVPADGFYEWSAGGRASSRVPYLFRRRDGALLAIAGLWEEWRDRESDERVLSCTLLTTEANASVRPVHDRMPVLLEAEDFERWLDPERTDARDVLPLLVPSAPDRLEAIAVSRHVNDPRNDDPGCVAPLA